jgi:hypothetical protein
MHTAEKQQKKKKNENKDHVEATRPPSSKSTNNGDDLDSEQGSPKRRLQKGYNAQTSSSFGLTSMVKT